MRSMEKLRILYVDDDPVHICLMCRIMDKSDYEVVAASSAKNAIAILEQDDTKSLKVLISDWIMPEMDGLELIQYVNDLYPDKVCYMLSSSAKIDTLKPYVEKGVIRKYFQKPVNKKLLLKEMDNIRNLLALN